MIPFRAIDLLGLFVEPAVICLFGGLAASYVLRRLFDRADLDRFVWNRALFDFAVLIAVTSLLILGLHVPEH